MACTILALFLSHPFQAQVQALSLVSKILPALPTPTPWKRRVRLSEPQEEPDFLHWVSLEPGFL